MWKIVDGWIDGDILRDAARRVWGVGGFFVFFFVGEGSRIGG